MADSEGGVRSAFLKATHYPCLCLGLSLSPFLAPGLAPGRGLARGPSRGLSPHGSCAGCSGEWKTGRPSV